MAESRELDLFAHMLETRGASVLRCPLVAMADAPDREPVERWLGTLARGEMQYVVLYTGEGLRRLMGFAERAGLGEAVVAALEHVCKVTRGPKPAKALRDLGLRTDAPAATPTTDGVIETLRDKPMQGAVIGVQLYGEEANEKLMTFLREQGATPMPVWPYVYASRADDRRVLEMIDAMAAGEVDLVAFTGSPQVRRLWSVARAHDYEQRLHAALTRTKVAAVGPVVASALEAEGATVDVMPERRHSLRPLTDAMIEALQEQGAG